MLAKTGLRALFEVIVSLDDIVNGKPDPEPYLRAAELLDVEPSELVVLRGHGHRRHVGEGGRSVRVGITRTLGADAHAGGRRARRPCRRRPRRAAVLVIAHRGASAELPENTLPAFERAIEIGADYVEFDVWNGARGDARPAASAAARTRRSPR